MYTDENLDISQRLAMEDDGHLGKNFPTELAVSQAWDRAAANHDKALAEEVLADKPVYRSALYLALMNALCGLMFMNQTSRREWKDQADRFLARYRSGRYLARITSQAQS